MIEEKYIDPHNRGQHAVFLKEFMHGENKNNRSSDIRTTQTDAISWYSKKYNTLHQNLDDHKPY